MKVGQNLDDNVRRAALMREEIGRDRKLMMDANQCWDVDEAIAQMKALARFDPWWIEEPTSPDDVLGHAAHRQGDRADRRRDRRGLPEPRDLQAAAAGRRHPLPAGRLLPHGRRERGARRDPAWPRKFGVPVCPHAGGVGPLRVRPAPVDLRLHRGQRLAWRTASASTWTTCTSTSSIPASSRTRATWRPLRPGYSIDDEAGVARRVRVPRRGGLAQVTSRRRSPGRAGRAATCAG